MTVEDIVTELLRREGGWRDAVQRPNGTWDPDTNKGITLPRLKEYRQKYLGTPAAETTAADLRALTDDEARQIYGVKYVQEPGFTEANIPFEPLRVQLIDFGVNSGPERAVRWLQRVIGLTGAAVDGVLGPVTRARLTYLGTCVRPGDDTIYRLINDALVAARSYMVDRAVDTGAMRKADEEGVESRALSFFLARP